MTAIIRKFRTFGTEQQRRRTMGGEIAANNLRREWEDMDMDTDAERLCREARDRVEQERMRDQER